MWLTVAHVTSHQHVARMAGAAVAAHGVVALVVTPSVPLAALVHICKEEEEDNIGGGTVKPRRREKRRHKKANPVTPQNVLYVGRDAARVSSTESGSVFRCGRQVEKTESKPSLFGFPLSVRWPHESQWKCVCAGGGAAITPRGLASSSCKSVQRNSSFYTFYLQKRWKTLLCALHFQTVQCQ